MGASVGGSWVEALAAAPDVDTACASVTDLLAGRGLLVSVYLPQGSRLRCRAVRGYWQIFDGIADTGVIGRTFRTGERVLLRGAPASPDYLEAAPGVVDELCVPLRSAGRTLGILNVECTRPLDAQDEQATDGAAAALAERLCALTLPPESAAQKLGRHGAALTTLAAEAEQPVLLRAVVAAAVDIAGMESAALCLDEAGGPVVHATAGPFADRLREVPMSQLQRIAAWVETGTSSYTVGTVDGIGFPGHEELRTSGAGSLVVLPLRWAGSRRGMLVVTTTDVLPLRTDEVQLLELLTATVASCLTIAESVQALRARAEADALTGLGHHAAFHAQLAPARQAERAGRLAVLYVDVDHFKSVNDTSGHAAGDHLLLTIADCMRGALRGDDRLFRIGGDEFAALATVAETAQALALGERLLDQVRARTGATLSVGVAVELPGESDAALLARADAAVYAAKASGRAAVRLAPDQLTTAVPAPRQVEPS